MHKEKTISWLQVAARYNQWVKRAGIARILSARPFGEVRLDRLSHTFGRRSLFLDERAGRVGLYLGSFSVIFTFIAERQACTQPSAILLPTRLSEAPSALRDLYLAVGENFVGHHLQGRLCTILPDSERAGEVIFAFEGETDRPDADPAATDADASMFRQIWRVLQRASEHKGRTKGQAGPDGGPARADTGRISAADGSRRHRGRPGQSRPNTRVRPIPRPEQETSLERNASPISRSPPCPTDFIRCC